MKFYFTRIISVLLVFCLVADPAAAAARFSAHSSPTKLIQPSHFDTQAIIPVLAVSLTPGWGMDRHTPFAHFVQWAKRHIRKRDNGPGETPEERFVVRVPPSIRASHVSGLAAAIVVFTLLQSIGLGAQAFSNAPSGAVAASTVNSAETQKLEAFFNSKLWESFTPALVAANSGRAELPGRGSFDLKSLRELAESTSPELGRLMGALINVSPQPADTSGRDAVVKAWTAYNHTILLPRFFAALLFQRGNTGGLYPYLTGYKVEDRETVLMTLVRKKQTIERSIEVFYMRQLGKQAFPGLGFSEASKLTTYVVDDQVDAIEGRMKAVADQPKRHFSVMKGGVSSPLVDAWIHDTFKDKKESIRPLVRQWIRDHELYHQAQNWLEDYMPSDHFGISPQEWSKMALEEQLEIGSEVTVALNMLAKSPLKPLTLLNQYDALLGPRTTRYYTAYVFFKTLAGKTNSTWVDLKDKEAAEKGFNQLLLDPTVPKTADDELDKAIPGLAGATFSSGASGVVSSPVSSPVSNQVASQFVWWLPLLLSAASLALNHVIPGSDPTGVSQAGAPWMMLAFGLVARPFRKPGPDTKPLRFLSLSFLQAA